MPKLHEDTPRRRGSRRDAERRTDDSKTSATGRGWKAVANKKIQNEASGEGGCRSFFLKDGESAIIQFLDTDPYCMDGHSIRNNSGRFEFVPCQLGSQRHCLMCEAGVKPTWKAAFKVLDYRGSWDKDKKRFKHDKPEEKMFQVSNRLALQIRKQMEKRGDLRDFVFEITRTGDDKSTSYSLELARDRNDDRIDPVEWEEQFPPVEDLCQPPSDEELLRKGFTSSDSYDGDKKGSRRSDDDDEPSHRSRRGPRRHSIDEGDDDGELPWGQ